MDNNVTDITPEITETSKTATIAIASTAVLLVAGFIYSKIKTRGILDIVSESATS